MSEMRLEINGNIIYVNICKICKKEEETNATNYLCTNNSLYGNNRFFYIQKNEIKFDPFNLYKELPKVSKKYQYKVKENQLGESIEIIHKGNPSYDFDLNEDYLKGMYIKLRNLSYESKRKYLRFMPLKHEQVYNRMFNQGVPVDLNHIHFKGGKNERVYSHILDKDVTRMLAEFVGIPYGSTLTSKRLNSEFGITTDLLAFDSSGLDVSCFEFLEKVLGLTAKLGLRGYELLRSLPNARLVKGKDVLYDEKKGGAE